MLILQQFELQKTCIKLAKSIARKLKLPAKWLVKLTLQDQQKKKILTLSSTKFVGFFFDKPYV